MKKSLKDKYIEQSIKECRIKNNFNLKKELSSKYYKTVRKM